MKRFIISAQVVLIVAGLVLFVLPRSWLPDYYKPIPMGLAAIVYAFFISVPALAVHRLKGTAVMENFQAALALGLLMCGLGSLGAWGWYQHGFAYDKLVHFILPAMMVYFGSKLLATIWRVRIPAAALAAAGIVALSGLAWEYIEAFFAGYFHLGFFGALFDYDSIGDLIANLSGVVMALIWLSAFPS